MTRTQIKQSSVYKHILSQHDAKRFSLLFGLTAPVISDNLKCKIKQLDETMLPQLRPGDVYIHVTEPQSRQSFVALLIPFDEEENRPNTEPDANGNDDEDRAMTHPEYADYDYWHITPITE